MTLRAFAEIVFDIRQEFSAEDGGPDFLGRSWDYRQVISEVYSRANIPSEDMPSIQAAIRYHVGNVMRERLTPKELEALGLKSSAPVERSREVRSNRTKALNALRGTSLDVSPIEALRSIHRLLLLVNRTGLKRLAAAERREAEEILRDVAERIERLEDRP
jgi:hypothetical protein